MKGSSKYERLLPRVQGNARGVSRNGNVEVFFSQGIAAARPRRIPKVKFEAIDKVRHKHRQIHWLLHKRCKTCSDSNLPNRTAGVEEKMRNVIVYDKEPQGGDGGHLQAYAKLTGDDEQHYEILIVVYRYMISLRNQA
ncbi:hypothetical protein EJB05_00188 [Eragrostis curvula]|uniref:Uncharacterized protein n=1 Tax=Eragrostis curvula TaxID=38414 RepID=A0A5J9WNN7_9POAL|nr:hypothetical protein EJB05_00188 [Eragrostis curvula]